MKPFILAVLALLCLGCQARQTNIALQQSDQAQEAAQKIVIERIAPRLPADVQASVKESMDQVIALLSASRTSIRPAIMLTSGGEPLPNPGTTVEDAMDRLYFLAKVARGLEAADRGDVVSHDDARRAVLGENATETR